MTLQKVYSSSGRKASAVCMEPLGQQASMDEQADERGGVAENDTFRSVGIGSRDKFIERRTSREFLTKRSLGGGCDVRR
jgi:hypothetical protein